MIDASTISFSLLMVLYSLAVARVTGLVTQDAITEGARDRLLVWLDDRPKTLGQFLADLIGCPWCVSMWISAVAAPLVWFYGQTPVMLVLASWLVFSQITGMIHNLGR
jgi:hypothetical protein